MCELCLKPSKARPQVSVVVVLQRDPLFVVGAGSFVDEMLTAAGARNHAVGAAEALDTGVGHFEVAPVRLNQSARQGLGAAIWVLVFDEAAALVVRVGPLVGERVGERANRQACVSG